MQYIEIGDRGGEGRAYGNVCNSYQALSDYQKAIECREKRVKIGVEIGDQRGEGRAYENLGDAYQSLGDHQKAIEYHKKTIENCNRNR